MRVVLIHGAGLDGRVFDRLRSHLSSHDVVTPDLRGRGAAPGDAATSVEEAAGQLAPLVDEHTLLMGHSYGGAVAIEIALRSRMKGLILVATGARLRVHPQILARAEAAAKANGPSARTAGWLDHTPRELIDAVDAIATSVPAVSTWADWRAANGFDRMEALGAIRSPTLVIGGNHDALTPPKYAQYLAVHIPAAELLMLEGAGHFAPVENASAVADAIVGFGGAR